MLVDCSPFDRLRGGVGGGGCRIWPPMPPEHHDRPQCGSGSGNGNQAANDAVRTLSSLQPQQSQQITSAGAGRSVGQSALSTRLFYLTPALRECFACVGATSRQYQWREVLVLVRDYIKLKNIIDPNDVYIINCKNDPLSSVLGVDSFAYGEQVKNLFRRQVIPVPNNVNTVPILTEPPLNSIRTPIEVTQISSNNSQYSTSRTVCETVGQGASLASTSSASGYTGALKGQNVLLEWNQCIPKIPAPESDTETHYSYQGYETALCHNTEYEESEAEEVSSYEEYELASDDAQEPDVPSEDNETDIENIELEVLNIDVYECREDSEDDWADEDYSSSSDEDPDLACFSWACLTCGIKNQPFVNYCEKCWKERKDIHPDRPRRRKRRKPRCKKRQRKISEKDIIESDIGESLITTEFLPPANFERSVSLDTTNISPYSMSKKSKSQDSVATVDYTSSQDSGIGSQDFFSEDILVEISKEFEMSESKETSIKKNETHIEIIDDNKHKPSCSNVEDEVKIVFERKDQKTFKKRRRSSNEESETTKRKKFEDAEEDKTKGWSELLQTDSFKEWFLSEEGHKFLYSKNTQDGLIMHSCSGDNSTPSTGLSALCSICLHRPKNGSIVHGRISHIATCYPCARRLLDTGSRCPVCRRKIHMVTKTIVT